MIVEIFLACALVVTAFAASCALYLVVWCLCIGLMEVLGWLQEKRSTPNGGRG